MSTPLETLNSFSQLDLVEKYILITNRKRLSKMQLSYQEKTEIHGDDQSYHLEKLYKIKFFLNCSEKEKRYYRKKLLDESTWGC